MASHRDEELHDDSSSVTTLESEDDISDQILYHDVVVDDGVDEVEGEDEEEGDDDDVDGGDDAHEFNSTQGTGNPDSEQDENSHPTKALVDPNSDFMFTNSSFMASRKKAQSPEQKRPRRYKPRPSGEHKKGSRKLAKWRIGHPDSVVRSQPDVVFEDESLAMPLDGDELRHIINRIEKDQTLCFKMRWYVARHLRQTFVKLHQPCYQPYAVRVRGSYYSMMRETGPQTQLKPYNRLDFEATRAHAGFEKDQPGWEQETTRIRMLQEAYAMFQWSKFVTDKDVDDVLIGAKVSPDIFYDAPRVDKATYYYNLPGTAQNRATDTVPRKSSHQVGTQPGHQADQFLQNTEPSYRRSKRKRVYDDGLETGHVAGGSAEQTLPRLFEELKSLREEVRELRQVAQEEKVFREKLLSLCAMDWGKERQFKETILASQDALLAELRELREATPGGIKRQRVSKDYP
ncbi:hypothetical protein F4809DRAFT_639627 [Biscogniauxia mediterranea]|nr:hypothetical protein F4809DRAFT_639627 [Biscogniauxia mediterranea]